MRLSIKAKQVVGVTAIVGAVVCVVSGLYIQALARIRLEDCRARAELLANAIYHRARAVAASGGDLTTTLREDDGLQSILEASAYDRNVTYAAIVETSGLAIAHSDILAVGKRLPPRPLLDTLLHENVLTQLKAIYADQAQTLEIQHPLLLGDVSFGSIRVGVSMLLVREEVNQALRPALMAAFLALCGAIAFALAWAQWLLRPIHLIRSGLTRLGRGEFGVTLDMPQRDELGELGGFFNALSTQLSADRARSAGERPTPAAVGDQFEDAVAFFAPDGTLVFANSAMRPDLADGPGAHGQGLDAVLPAGHPYRSAVEDTLRTASPQGPLRVPGAGSPAGGGSSRASDAAARSERLIATHVIPGPDGQPIGVMLVARDVGYLDQVQTTLDYSRKLAALGRLTAGVAHEIKNPVNAILIHLELLKQQLTEGQVPRRDAGGQVTAPQPLDLSAARDHVSIIATALHRLDDVVQGFLKFARPDELTLQPVAVRDMLDELMPIVNAVAQSHGITVEIECPNGLPMLRGDRAMLQQAFLNLAINACDAMPNGGRLRIAARELGRQVEVLVEDTGVGIPAERLGRVFDLYFTTKEGGSGIGLSLVYRTVQLHDGEIAVESTLGQGTVFRVTLPQV